MKPPPDNTNRDPDPLGAYADGDPDAVRAMRPREPNEAQWEAVRLRIHAQLGGAAREPEGAPRRWRVGLWSAGAVTLAAAAAAVAWVVLAPPPPPSPPTAPAVVETRPAPGEVAVAPLPHEPQPDPLAEFAVLPIAGAEDVVLHRVPGDGWLPVGAHPLPGAVELASPDDVELDEPNPAWPSVTPAPGYAPMIFAAKPR
jgi:hypothetical protein